MISSYGFSTNEVPFMSRKPVVLLFLATLVAAPAIPQTAIAQNAIAKTAVAQRTASQAVGPALGIPSTAIAINSPTPLSQRVVHYAIDAKYDPKTHALDAQETLTYHNLTGQALDTFPFHLYLNAFQPTSTWIRETKRDGTRDVSLEEWDKKNYGAEEIQRFEVVLPGTAPADLTAQLKFIQLTTPTRTIRQSFRSICRGRFLPTAMSSSKSLSTISFPKPWSAPAGSGISCSPVSGSPKLASGGTEPGTAINFTAPPNFSPTSASTM